MRPDEDAPPDEPQLPEPIAPTGNPPDHPATADRDELPPGGSVLDAAMHDLLGEEGDV